MHILEFSIVWQFFSAFITFLVGIGLLEFIRKKTQVKTKENLPAGFWVRAICLGVDLALIDILTSVLAYRGSLVAAGYITLLLSFGYFFFSWSFFGATPAMRMARIKISSIDGKPLKVWQLVVRVTMYVFLIVGWIPVLFDRKNKRALHDLVAKTSVVYAEKGVTIEKNVISKMRLVMLGLVGVLLISLIINGLGEKITRYSENSQTQLFDLNQDTLMDGLTIDTDKDGKADVFKYDLNNDRVIEFTTMDADKDGVAESLDLNNDGRIDGFDFDKDNKIDIPLAKGQFFIWLWRVWFGLLLTGIVGILVFIILQENKLIRNINMKGVNNEKKTNK